ncbi:integrase core domain-containing protein [Clostridium homopropionicum]|uniref:integrase core domain-containing protein n=1 Tax=Clostridium homopropionicum TaxID=36844 RepID=UPI003BFA7859
MPVKTPNKNAHVESFYRIFEDECLKINEFQNYAETYKTVNEFIEFYNNIRMYFIVILIGTNYLEQHNIYYEY